jgi:hypothetical protein
MVSDLEQETRCTDVQKSEGKNRFLDNPWTTFLAIQSPRGTGSPFLFFPPSKILGNLGQPTMAGTGIG